MKTNLYILLAGFLFVSCSYLYKQDTIDIGNDYYFVGNGDESSILYCYKELNKSQNPCEKNSVIVPKQVTHYCNNDSLLLVKSKSFKGEYCFWKIDLLLKEKNVTKIDSIGFYGYLHENSLSLINPRLRGR